MIPRNIGIFFNTHVAIAQHIYTTQVSTGTLITKAKQLTSIPRTFLMATITAGCSIYIPKLYFAKPAILLAPHESHFL